MILPSPLDPGLLVCTAAIIVLGLAGFAAGCVLVPRHTAGDDWLVRCATQSISGLLFLAGISSLLVLQRVSYVVLIPIVQIAFAAWSWRKRGGSEVAGGDGWSGVAGLGWVLIGCIALEWWQTGWLMPDGTVRIVHYDLGYFAMQVRSVLETGSTDLWTTTLGKFAGGTGRDVWYHWSPIWLAAFITKVTGMLPLAALMHVVATVTDVMLVLVTGAIVRHLTGMRHGRCLLAGFLSILAAQLLRELGRHWLGLSEAAGSLHHSRLSLIHAFSYKFEGMVLLAALLSWLRKEQRLAMALLACAAVSAPHTTACCGAAAGVLGGFGVVLRNKKMIQMALVMIVIVGGVWGVLAGVFGAGLPKAEGQSLLVLNPGVLFQNGLAGLKESFTALLLGALSLPGVLHLILSRDERASEEGRILGWLALSGIIGSYIGYRLLGGVADGWHIIIMTHAVLVMPAGVWGLVRMASWNPGAVRWACMALIMLCAAMGARDLVVLRSEFNQRPWHESDLARLKEALHHRSFGYYAKKDRPWWIPWHSTLAALMDCRCIRLHVLPGEVQKSGTRSAEAHYYGTTRPWLIVPPVQGETEKQWSLRFSKQVGIECFLEIGKDKLPDEIKSKSRELLSLPLIKAFELLPESR